MPSKILSLAMLAIVVLGTSGCGNSSPKTIRVTGSVTFDGKAMTKGKVTFLPIREGDGELNRPAIGTIKPDGTYELSTFKPGDGAIPGKYKVTVVDETVPDPEEVTKGATATSSIPGGYASPATSGLTADVTDGSGKFDFELKTGGVPDAAPQQQQNVGGADQYGT